MALNMGQNNIYNPDHIRFGPNITIGNFNVFGENVVIEDGATVGNNNVFLDGVHIGAGTAVEHFVKEKYYYW